MQGSRRGGTTHGRRGGNGKEGAGREKSTPSQIGCQLGDPIFEREGGRVI
jgi:hypothetical protein